MDNTPNDKPTEQPQKLRRITLQDVQTFFADKKAQNGCPCCSQVAWTYLEAPPDYSWSLSSNKSNGDFVMPAPSIPTILLACNNCGFIRPHAAMPILEHLDNKGGGK